MQQPPHEQARLLAYFNLKNKPPDAPKPKTAREKFDRLRRQRGRG